MSAPQAKTWRDDPCPNMFCQAYPQEGCFYCEGTGRWLRPDEGRPVNPYDGLAEAITNDWQARPTEPLTRASLEQAWLAFASEPLRPTMYHAWCSRCEAAGRPSRGYSFVAGDQAEWHGCE